MEKSLLSFLILFSFTLMSTAQVRPVTWAFGSEKISDTEYDLVITANLSTGWYVYSQYLESDEGPVATSISFNEVTGFEKVGKTKEGGNKKEGYDKLFDMNIVKYSSKVAFTQRIKVPADQKIITGDLEFMTCDDEKCLPPRQVDFKIALE
ncbi:MAG: sugar transporter [Bacteroidetes bacterium]|nr:sugar transporter [Bacteroidota bacterium]